MKTKVTGLPIVPHVPAHWEIKRLKEVASIALGKMLSTEATSRLTVELPYVRSANLSQLGPLSPESLKRMWFSPLDARRLAIRNGDILVSEGGSIGQPLLVEGLPNDAVIGLQNSVNRVRGSANQRYLFYWLKFLFDGKFHQNNIDIVSIGHLTKEKLADVPVLLPPLGEQDRLVEWLDTQLRRVQRRSELLGAKRELLRDLLASATEHATLGTELSVPKSSTGIDWLPQVSPAHVN